MKENIQVELCLWGKIIQITEIRKNIKHGAIKNNILFELWLTDSIFKNNLTASLKGCKRP